MLHMPRRSVTRFFIPLIDVLILLFCIFLLMEFNSETEVDRQVMIVADQSESIDLLQSEVVRRTKELQQFEEDRPKLQELAKLRKELEALQKASLLSLQQRTFFRVIDIDRNDGTLSFYDETRPGKPRKLSNDNEAQKLIEDHQKEAAGREVYYYFMRTRPTDEDIRAKKLASGYPTKGQITRYQAMFPVANNLAEYR